MSLDGLLLEKLAKWRPDGRQVLDISDPDSHWDAVITADAADVVGCRLWEISLRPNGRFAPVTDLKLRAEAIAAGVTGLMESLKLIEVDEPRGVALVRSASPAERGDVVSYYELLLNADGRTLFRRYDGHRGEITPREQVVFSLTQECLAKLVSDLIA
jgi:hypothetical protein